MAVPQDFHVLNEHDRQRLSASLWTPYPFLCHECRIYFVFIVNFSDLFKNASRPLKGTRKHLQKKITPWADMERFHVLLSFANTIQSRIYWRRVWTDVRWGEQFWSLENLISQVLWGNCWFYRAFGPTGFLVIKISTMSPYVLYQKARLLKRKLLKSLASGLWFAQFSRVLPTSCMGFYAGKPVESAVYSLYKQIIAGNNLSFIISFIIIL